MKQVALRVLPAFGGTLVERDVRDDAETRRRYLTEIPVLLLGDAEIARHRVSEAELAARLGRLVTGQP